MRRNIQLLSKTNLNCILLSIPFNKNCFVLVFGNGMDTSFFIDDKYNFFRLPYPFSKQCQTSKILDILSRQFQYGSGLMANLTSKKKYKTLYFPFILEYYHNKTFMKFTFFIVIISFHLLVVNVNMINSAHTNESTFSCVIRCACVSFKQ